MTDFDPSNFDFNLPFDKWVKFVFDHPVNDDIKSAWYWDDKWRDVRDEWDWGEKANPELQLKHATQLFQDPAFLLTTYNPEQINHGFWFLLSGPSGFALNDLLWDATLSWPIREQCILAMVNVFRVIFIRRYKK